MADLDTSSRRTVLSLPQFVGMLEAEKVYKVPEESIEFRKSDSQLQYRPCGGLHWYNWPCSTVTDTTGCCSACSVHLDGMSPNRDFFVFLEYICSWLGVNTIQTSVLSYSDEGIQTLTDLGYVEAYRHPVTRCVDEVEYGVEVIQYYKVFPSKVGYLSDIGEEFGEDFLDGQVDGSSANF